MFGRLLVVVHWWRSSALNGVSDQKPAPDEPTTSSSRNVYARSTTVMCGEPLLSNARTPAAKINETNRDTQSLALPTPRFARKVSNWNSPKNVKGTYPQNIMVSNRGIRSRECISINSLTLQHSQCWKMSFKTDECSCSTTRTRTERHRSCTGKLVARFVRMVGGFHRKSDDPRSVSIKEYTRKHFS